MASKEWGLSTITTETLPDKLCHGAGDRNGGIQDGAM